MEYFRAFGLTICSDLPLENWLSKADSNSTDLTVARVNELPDSVQPIIYSSVSKTTQGQHRFTVQRHVSGWLIRMQAGVDFWILQTEILVCFEQSKLLLAILHLLSLAMAFWLEQNGLRTLHASSIVLEGHAAVFLANSTTGKSTLTAALLQNGGELLSDDIVPVESVSDGFLLQPGYASLRLSPELAKYFLKERSGLAVSIPNYPKYLVQIGAKGWTPYYDQKIAPDIFYILKRISEPKNKRIEIMTLSHKEATLSLLRYLFFPISQSMIVDQAQRLEFLSQLASKIPVKQLIIPSGYQYLPSVSEAVRNDLLHSNDLV